MSWIWLLPLGLGALAAGGLWVALAHLRGEIEGLARAGAALAGLADHAGSRAGPEGEETGSSPEIHPDQRQSGWSEVDAPRRATAPPDTLR